MMWRPKLNDDGRKWILDSWIELMDPGTKRVYCINMIVAVMTAKVLSTHTHTETHTKWISYEKQWTVTDLVPPEVLVEKKVNLNDRRDVPTGFCYVNEDNKLPHAPQPLKPPSEFLQKPSFCELNLHEMSWKQVFWPFLRHSQTVKNRADSDENSREELLEPRWRAQAVF